MRKEKLFEKIGEMTILFATLEHQLQSLLEILLGEKSRLIGPFFIHELNLTVLLRKIKHMARYRMQGNGAQLLGELERLLKQIEATKDVRNLLVHGNWQIDEECSACPVRVRDFKIRFDEGQWHEQTETTFNEKKLTHLVRRLHGMCNQTQHITRRLLDSQTTTDAAR